MKRRSFHILLIFALCLAMVLPAAALLSGCTHGDESITSLSQLNEKGRTIAVSDGTPEEAVVREDFRNADILAYSNIIQAYTEVANGRIDACIHARREMELAVENGVRGVRLLDETYCENTIAVGLSRISPIPDLKNKINTFLRELKAVGTLDDMYNRWVVEGNETMPYIPAAENPEYTLRVATTGTVMPYSYYIGDELAGYDIELAMRFASWLGAGLQFKIYDFGGILAAAQSGDVDCIMSNLYYTPEHEEAIDFSDPVFLVEVTAMVKSGSGTAAEDDGEPEYSSLDELDGQKIGIMTGSIFTPYVEQRLPNSEIVYFDSNADLVTALKSHKIEAFPLDETSLKAIMEEEDGITYPDEYLARVEMGLVFPKTDEGQKLCDEVSEWLRGLKESGELDKLFRKWNDGPEEEKTVLDYESLPAVNGSLTGATAAVLVPFNYIADGKPTGFDIDLASRFCKEKGYALQMEVFNFDGVLAAIENGKADFGASGFAITEERKETVLFSEPYHESGSVMAVLKKEPVKESFWEAVTSSFEKTFIRENRWKLFVQGTCTTLLITGLSILFGTLLGFVVYLACRTGNRMANLITRFCVWLVEGMPVVVFLMILYYIIFGRVSVSGTFVSVIAFTLIFGSAVYSMLQTGVGAVDKGQAEAAYALGYSDRKTFFRIVLPQAMQHIMPLYTGQVTSLIKATAIVGYIAVQDLTKIGDIIRSRTYEAFFPLIAIAVIYFVLAAVLTLLVKRIGRQADTGKRRRKTLLKGVKLHD